MSEGARVLVAGGHSAGHIEPAMNLADALRALDPAVQITALGTERGLDTTLIPARGYPLELIPPVPLPRKWRPRASSTACRATAASRARLSGLHPGSPGEPLRILRNERCYLLCAVSLQNCNQGASVIASA